VSDKCQTGVRHRKEGDYLKAEDYLLQVRMLNKKINNKKIELSQLRSMTTSTSAPITGERVQSSHAGDELGSMICKIVTMEQEIIEQIDRFVDLKQEIISVIEQCSEPDVYDVLHMYYIQELTWKQVSKKKRFTYQWIKELNRKGLEEVQTLLNNKNIG